MQVLSLDAAKYRRCTYLDKGKDLFIVVTLLHLWRSSGLKMAGLNLP